MSRFMEVSASNLVELFAIIGNKIAVFKSYRYMSLEIDADKGIGCKVQ